MIRPPRPRMINNIHPRSSRPYNHQWRPNNTPTAPFPWRARTRFGEPNVRTENGAEHWCETCDRDFPTAELLHKHKQQHQKCNIDGCQFVAHPKVITKHIQMQHSSGIYKKIANLNNPEDIQKWREERKKKYPTKSNIEKKAAQYKEKVERGEKMALNHVKNDRHKSSGQGPRKEGMKRKHNFDKTNQNQRTNRQNFKSYSSASTSTNNETKQPAKKIPKIIPSAPTTLEKNKLKPFTGILNIEMDDKAEDTVETSDCSYGLFDEDDYNELLEVPKETTNTQEPVVCGALSSLMCDYETSDEESEEKENELLNKLQVPSNQKPFELAKIDDKKAESAVLNIPEIIANESDDGGPEEIKIVKSNDEHETAQVVFSKTKANEEKKKVPIKNKETQNYKLKRKIPSTLLQKLLHKEIRQERNIVLQCIRYIKKHNYFNKLNQ